LCEGFHLVGGEGAQKVERRTEGIGVAVPAVQVSGLEDDQDEVVNRSNQIVRIEFWRLWIR
jgi:hypothetical protein